MEFSDQPPKLIGASVTRLEDAPLVLGRGLFAADVSFPLQLHMRVVRSAVAHGRVVAIDVAKARSCPGVVAAWTSAGPGGRPRALRGRAGRGRVRGRSLSGGGCGRGGRGRG